MNVADRLLTTEEVAGILRTTPAGIYAMRYRKIAPPSVVVGRRRLFPESQLQAWLADRMAATG